LHFPATRNQETGLNPTRTRLAHRNTIFCPRRRKTCNEGWYDPGEKPKLVINSGDTVSIETISHSLGQIRPGVDMDGIVKLRKENDDGGGPHSITGPIYVSGAEPGDTNCRVTQVVDIRKGVHCMIPKRVFVG